MLGKMLIHGLIAAVIVGSAATVYAQAKDNGYLVPATALERKHDTTTDVGGIPPRPAAAMPRPHEQDPRHDARSARRHEGHDHKRHHDDDED